MRSKHNSGDGMVPVRSLRREWSRSFTVMLALFVSAAVATMTGLHVVVTDVERTAHQLHAESVAVAALKDALTTHEQVGHQLLSGNPVNRVAYVAQQHSLGSLFESTSGVFSANSGLREVVDDASRTWRAGLVRYGLWGTEALRLHGDHSADNPLYGAASDATAGQLDSLSGPSLDAMDSGLAHDGDLELALLAGLVVLFGAAVGATLYFRRRMIIDLMRPVTGMHDGVRRLRAGDYGHRLPVLRRDELGDLVEAFNSMADALHASHMEITMRATHDWLTGLPNRALLAERLATTPHPDGDRRSRTESVLFIDVDDFKTVNDTLGHDGGDVLLIELAGRLRHCARAEDMVARLGGDEFAIVVARDVDGTAASSLASRIIAATGDPFTVNGHKVMVSVSIGVAQRQQGVMDPADLLRAADFAMYMAKGGGKNGYQLYDSAVHAEVVARSAMQIDSAPAMLQDQLS